MTAYLRSEFKDAIQTPIVLEEINTEKEAKLLAATARIKAVTERANLGEVNAVLGSILFEMRKIEAEAGWFTNLEDKSVGILNIPGVPYYMSLRKALNLAPGQVLDSYYTLLFTSAHYSFMKKHFPEQKAVVLPAEQKEVNFLAELPFAGEELELTEISVQAASKDVSAEAIDSDYFELNSLKPKAGKDDDAAEIKESNKPPFSPDELKSVLEKLKIDKLQCEAAIKELSKRRFGADVVHKMFEKIPAAYEALQSSKGRVGNRKDYIDFLRVVNVAVKNASADDLIYYNLVRQAIALMIVEDIDAERLTFSCDLYDLCKAVLNIKKSCEISNLDRYVWYSTLQGFMSKLESTQFVSSFTGRLLKRISATYDEMSDGHINPIANGVKIAVNLFTELTTAVAVGTFAGSLVAFAPGENIFSRGVGSLAKSYWGYPGKLVGERVGVILEQAAVNSVISKTIKYGTDYFVRLPGEAAYQAINFPFAIVKAIAAYMATPPQKPFYRSLEFISMLLSLPDEVLDAKTKEKLSKIDIYRQPFVLPSPVVVPPVKHEKRRNSVPTLFRPSLGVDEPEGATKLFQGEITIAAPSL